METSSLLLKQMVETIQGGGDFKRTEAIALLTIMAHLAERLEKLERLNEVRPE